MGVVLDDQFYLCDEAPLSKDFKNLITKIDDKDTIVIGEYINIRYRDVLKLGTKITKELKEKESAAYIEMIENGGQPKSTFDIDEEIKNNIFPVNQPMTIRYNASSCWDRMLISPNISLKNPQS